MPTAAEVFRDSLFALIAELKSDGRSERRIPLRNGVRKDTTKVGTIYAFAWSDPVDLIFEGAAVRFQTGSTAMDATVALFASDQIFLLLTRDLGAQIETATIVIDQTSFLEALRRRMDDISTGRAINFNATLANKVLNNAQDARAANLKPEVAERLSEEQRHFIALALSSTLVWLWGPPGTGKTWTLTALVEKLHSRNERTLIVSNTNKAVDQVLLALCRRVGRDHPGIVNGEFVRVGRIAHPELEREWADVISPEKIAERLSSSQRSKIEVLRAEQAHAKIQHEKLREEIQSTDQGNNREPALKRLKEIETRLAEIAAEIAPLQREIDEIAAQVVAKARVVGATITKTFLSPSMFAEFDATIIDEVSMVLLPACYHAAGLARIRVEPISKLRTGLDQL